METNGCLRMVWTRLLDSVFILGLRRRLTYQDSAACEARPRHGRRGSRTVVHAYIPLRLFRTWNQCRPVPSRLTWEYDSSERSMVSRAASSRSRSDPCLEVLTLTDS